MNMREFTFGIVIFSTVLLFGTLFYTSMTTYYPSAVVPTEMNDIRDLSQHSITNIVSNASTEQEAMKSHETGLLGTVEVIWSVTNMMWGVVILFIDIIPNTIIGLVGYITNVFHLPYQFVQVVVGLIGLFIIFEIVSIIFKRET